MIILSCIISVKDGIMTCTANNALVIIDMQNDFMDYGGLPVEGSVDLVPSINQLQNDYNTIILTQDWHPENHSSFCTEHNLPEHTVIDMPYGKQTLWPPHCIMDSYGSDIAVGLKTSRAQLIIRKGYQTHLDSYSAFYENDHQTPTGLHGYLQERNISDLTFVGVAYDFCVSWSAKDAAKLGYNVTVLKDYCAAIDLDGSADYETKLMKELGVTII